MSFIGARFNLLFLFGLIIDSDYRVWHESFYQRNGDSLLYIIFELM